MARRGRRLRRSPAKTTGGARAPRRGLSTGVMFRRRVGDELASSGPAGAERSSGIARARPRPSCRWPGIGRRSSRSRCSFPASVAVELELSPARRRRRRPCKAEAARIASNITADEDTLVSEGLDLPQPSRGDIQRRARRWPTLGRGSRAPVGGHRPGGDIRQAAVAAYVDAGSSGAVGLLLEGAPDNTSIESTYLRVATDNLNSSVAELGGDEAVLRSSLASEEAEQAAMAQSPAGTAAARSSALATLGGARGAEPARYSSSRRLALRRRLAARDPPALRPEAAAAAAGAHRRPRDRRRRATVLAGKAPPEGDHARSGADELPRDGLRCHQELRVRGRLPARHRKRLLRRLPIQRLDLARPRRSGLSRADSTSRTSMQDAALLTASTSRQAGPPGRRARRSSGSARRSSTRRRTTGDDDLVRAFRWIVAAVLVATGIGLGALAAGGHTSSGITNLSPRAAARAAVDSLSSTPYLQIALKVAVPGSPASDGLGNLAVDLSFASTSSSEDLHDAKSGWNELVSSSIDLGRKRRDRSRRFTPSAVKTYLSVDLASLGSLPGRRGIGAGGGAGRHSHAARRVALDRSGCWGARTVDEPARPRRGQLRGPPRSFSRAWPQATTFSKRSREAGWTESGDHRLRIREEPSSRRFRPGYRRSSLTSKSGTACGYPCPSRCGGETSRVRRRSGPRKGRGQVSHQSRGLTGWRAHEYLGPARFDLHRRDGRPCRLLGAGSVAGSDPLSDAAILSFLGALISAGAGISRGRYCFVASSNGPRGDAVGPDRRKPRVGIGIRSGLGGPTI